MITTIQEGKDMLREKWEKGVDCPCCGQLVKRYSRSMHTMMAVALIALYRAWIDDHEYHHISEFAEYRGIGDFAKLRYWGLIEEKEKGEGDDHKRTSGYWKITEKGELFVKGKISVPRRVALFNQKFLGLEGDPMTIQEALGKKFNYQDLMEGR